ncbi:MAG: hypothetical protein ACXWBP_01175 [Limisphaerales bacterium]
MVFLGGVSGLAVFILTVLLSPSKTHTGPSQELIVGTQLKRITFTKQLWADDRHATNGSVIPDDDLRRFLGNSFTLTNGERENGFAYYQPNPIGTPPIARLQRKTRSLPEGTLLKWIGSNRFEAKLPDAGESAPWLPVADAEAKARLRDRSMGK